MKEKKSRKGTKKKSVKPRLKRIDKEFYLVVGVMVGLILVFLVSYSVFQALRTFEYEGLSFTKEKFGEIDLYHYYYFANPTSPTGAIIGEPRQVNLYIQNDPRENEVPVDGEISYIPGGKFVYISVNTTDLPQCADISAGISSLTTFVIANGFQVRGASPNQTEAEANGIKYATCENRPERMVLLIQEGNETKITKSDDCYTIDINNCEVLPALEKFMVQSIIDARTRRS